jgi:AP-1 complex subunit gamma-1
MKLTDRFSSASTERLKQLISTFQNNIEVELQQRSCEYSKLFAWDNVKKVLLERIPVVEEKKDQLAPAIAIKSSGGASLIEMWDEIPSATPTPAGTWKIFRKLTFKAPAKQSPAAPAVGGGLDILGEIFGSPSTPAPSVSAPTPVADSLLDLLGGPSISTPTPVPVPSPMFPPVVSLLGDPIGAPLPAVSQPCEHSLFGSNISVNGPLPTFTAFEKNGLKVLFDTIKNSQFPNITVVNISYMNSSAFPLINFDLKVAVPKVNKIGNELLI